MNRFFYECCLCFLLIAFISCKSHSYSFPEEANNKTTYTLKDSIYYTLFHTENNTYGFDVIKNGKVYIHQPLVPCWQGLQHFKSEQDAVTVAKFIVNKLRAKNFKFLLQKFEIDSLIGSGKKYVNLKYKLPVQDTNANIIDSNDFNSISGIASEIIPLLNAPIKNKWTVKESVPFGDRNGGFCFTIDKNVYIGSGESRDEIIKDMWCYNVDLETWTCLAEIPAKCFSGFAFSILKKGYVGLGTEIGTSSGKFEKHIYQYNPLFNLWNIKKDFPGRARIDPAYFVIGNKGYVGTGYDGSNTKDFYEYDPLQDKWKQIADFAGGNLHASVGISNSKKGFMVAGARAPRDFKFCYEYIPTINKWERRQDFPGYERNFHSGNYIDTNFFIAGAGGSYELNERLRDFYVYNIRNNSWSQADDYPCDINGSTRAVSGSIDGKIYMGTGVGRSYLNDWKMYEYYFSIRKDTGVYDEGTCYPLKYNDTWELYQECTDKNCYAGAQIKSSEDLGNICYRSHLTNTNEELSFRRGNNKKNFQVLMLPRWFNLSAEKTPTKPIGVRLFFTREEIESLAGQFEKNTGKVFSSDKIKILQYNGNHADENLLSDNTDLSEYKLISPQLFSYGFHGETLVAEFNVTSLRSSFYLVIQSE